MAAARADAAAALAADDNRTKSRRVRALVVAKDLWRDVSEARAAGAQLGCCTIGRQTARRLARGQWQAGVEFIVLTSFVSLEQFSVQSVMRRTRSKNGDYG